MVTVSKRSISCFAGFISPFCIEHTFIINHSFDFSSTPSAPAGFATSFLVTVVTSTSWNVIDMVASTNITESGAPMLSPSRCSRCVESSNETCRLLPQPSSLYLPQLHCFLPPSPRIPSWCFTIKMFTTLLFCSVAT